MRKRFGIALGVAAATMLALGAQSAAAGTINVTSTNDSGPGSLRTAINWANQNPGPDRIVIEATGTIQLQDPLPRLLTAMAIQGPGSTRLSLRGQADGAVSAALRVEDSRVHIEGISIDHGRTGISIYGGAVAIVRSRVSDNNWGILNGGGATLSVIESSLVDNRYEGIKAAGATVEVRRSTVRGSGVGITTLSLAPSSLKVSQSTLIGNREGITSGFGPALIDRSTLSGNRRWAVRNYELGSVAITQSTLSGNASDGRAAIIDSGDPTSTTLKSTIVANSPGGTNCAAPVISKGHNLADDGSCGLTAQGDKLNTEPLLKPLDFYGGPTKTFALPAASPAIDAGLADTTQTDQRGLPRIADYPGVPKAAGGDNSDIGAFELQAP
jgi:hypothetical protein